VSFLTLEREGAVFILRMNAGENRFHDDSVAELNAALDEVVASQGNAALVSTGAEKFFSNGFDVNWIGEVGTERGFAMVANSMRLIGRLLSLPVATVAAINGHAFGMGALWGLAHDYRYMRVDRGYWCMPEIDLGMPLPATATELLRNRLSHATFRHAVLSGARIGGAEAAQLGIVDEALSEDNLLAQAVEHAGQLASKARPVIASIKRSVYEPILAVAEGPDPAATNI